MPQVIINTKIVLLFFCVFSVPASFADSPVIAVAANAQFAMQDISKHFAAETGLGIRMSFGSSGNFVRQIMQGAPFELFLAADESYIRPLLSEYAGSENSVLYAKGSLILYIANSSKSVKMTQDSEIVAYLSRPEIGKLAIANPEHAPYGRAAMQTLQSIHLWQALQPNLVLGENIAQAAQFIAGGAVQIGLLAKSLALRPQLRDRGVLVELPQTWYQPLEQHMLLLNSAGDTTKKFYNYLQQPQAQRIFIQHGFQLP